MAVGRVATFHRHLAGGTTVPETIWWPPQLHADAPACRVTRQLHRLLLLPDFNDINLQAPGGRSAVRHRLLPVIDRPLSVTASSKFGDRRS